MFHIQRLKIGMTLMLTAALFGGSSLGLAQSSSSVTSNIVQVTALGKAFKVNVVTINLTDPMLELSPALAKGGIGHDEPFATIIDREQAVAAVNGTFFNAYESNPYIRYPNGALLESGELVHSGENQTLYLNKDKAANIEFIDFDIAVHVSEGSRKYTVSPWGVNKYYGSANTDQVIWYTPDYGSWIGFPNGTKVVVREGRITRITENAVPVPEDGYVLFVGSSTNNRQNLLPQLKVGNTVTLELLAKSQDGRSMDAKDWLTAIGVGPKLVTGGIVDLNFSRDGFTDPKLTRSAAARSFVGIDANGRLVMGTVPAATMSQLAAIVVQLQLKEAMNMDGGASSALYANGQTLTAPGRKLSNVLVVRKLDKPKVQIEIDDRYIPDFQGFIVKDTTMVPIRPFITALNAEFQWDTATRTAVISSGAVTMKLQDGSSAATVNSKDVSVPVPLQILEDSRMYVPLRFVSETLGATVEWDNRLYRASLKLP
ncbi:MULTISPECIES: phosphodiester glycosidase family protein [unclassified Paenibacillus]|uniref:stalk domain-containing protein n=1 Tax=unclassified Paenibacillus TaxID=185978 RepID=UPI001AE1C06D|nr:MULTISPECIES: phosphodiester glycosidase family protein [unclassified Paenibacillus]MBP1155539.1 exopolysaccharide biosynthesis protein [Paenibacillus sp. PvP091]MBP1169075.1 exopolysaccharide biosynthesis protein [Paenibacillus sp. PvR098]MBP2440103.1 exopolysaccharide biosynthesis protein [Paenibacillus sp. PvP052]